MTSIKKMQLWARKARRQGETIGFVPTMGCLHDGHLSLMRAARRENDYLVVSVFVNPLQFGPSEDFKKYPRDFNRDKKLLCKAKADIVFLPQAKAMYPHKAKSLVNVEGLSEVLCGVTRPGHFRGVATVVLKLFNIVEPRRAYFGQKDAQQALIIRQMVKDLNLPLEIKVLPIVRESDGLAMSSRNRYLSTGERAEAIILYKSLQSAVGMIESGNKSPREIAQTINKMIKSQRSARIEYVKIVDAQTLEKVTVIKGKVLIALAVFIGATRLIDNVTVRA
ncbi:MAG: pantoate--beta-alanine ligase [Candidatus Omnitrophota bacterium]